MKIGMHGFVVRAHEFVIVVITRKKSCFCNCHMEQKFSYLGQVATNM
jgi:hypothetical protein